MYIRVYIETARWKARNIIRIQATYIVSEIRYVRTNFPELHHMASESHVSRLWCIEPEEQNGKPKLWPSVIQRGRQSTAINISFHSAQRMDAFQKRINFRVIPIDTVDIQQVLRRIRHAGFEIIDTKMCWIYVFFEVTVTEAAELNFVLKSLVQEGAEFICSSKSVVIEDAESIFSLKSLNLFSV